MEHLSSEIIDQGIDRMRQNAFDSWKQQGKMSHSAFHIFTLSVSTFFSGLHVGRPTVGTKSFDSASNSIWSDDSIGYMTNRSSCLTSMTSLRMQTLQSY